MRLEHHFLVFALPLSATAVGGGTYRRRPAWTKSGANRGCLGFRAARIARRQMGFNRMCSLTMGVREAWLDR